MRCLCSSKSNSYVVTTVPTPVKAKISTQRVVKTSVENGVDTNTTGQATANTTATNGFETSKTPTTEVQIHNNHQDDVSRYQDTAKTVAKEFGSISTTKNSTPEGILKNKKNTAPQPTTSKGPMVSHNSSESQGTASITSESKVTPHKTIESHMISPPTSESNISSNEISELHLSSSENSSIKSPHTSQETPNHSSTVIETKSEPSLVPVTKEITTSTSTTLNGANADLITEPVTESINYTSSTENNSKVIVQSKSEASLLTVPSPTNTLTKSSSVSSIVETTASLEPTESLENLSNDRKESLGELIAGSNRSSTSLEEHSVRRRSGVQVSVLKGPEVTSEEELPVFKKSPEDEEKIRKAIEKNEFLTKILSGKRLQDIINAMQPKNVISKQKLIKQGEKGSEMFVSKEGTFKILIKGKVVGEFHDSRVFGELAILYNAKRLASIQAATTGKVWVLDRHVYQKIVISSNLQEQDENLKFLQNVESLNVVSVDVLRQVSNLLKPEFFISGTVIIRQGDKGDKFYIIRAGTVTISKTGEGVLGKLGKGQCFGEMALQKEDTRQATVTAEAPGVECLTLTRSDFINHFGDVEIPQIEVKKISFGSEAPSEYQDIKLEDLKIVKTLGVGGFGRVELVQHKKKKDLIFALKYLKKIDIVYQNQQEHVYNEKLIQMNSRSPFIVRLYRTYKDNKYVYFLMESCLGGDLFSLLHKQKGKRFEEKDARFLSACVLESLEHLHSKGVVYRDLKPENLLIDKNGYLKLTDFGFAKKMPGRGKTFTFAGTPEYVAPEIVLNRGHDKAVDYWAFGVFIFELLTGRTPFRTGDSSHMRTYNKILNGIDNVNFPTYMNPRARNLIEKLCRPVPAERLGMQRGATRDIKAHKWYQGFDWMRFQQCQIISPFKPKLKDLTDTSNFDLFKQDKDYPPDEVSGWDIHF